MDKSLTYKGLTWWQVEKHMVDSLNHFDKEIKPYLYNQNNTKLASKVMNKIEKLDDWYMNHFDTRPDTSWTTYYDHTNTEFHDLIDNDMLYEAKDGRWYLAQGSTLLNIPSLYTDSVGNAYIQHDRLATVYDVHAFIQQYNNSAVKELRTHHQASCKATNDK